VDRCVFHNARARPLTLLSDYECGPEQLPTCTAQVGASTFHVLLQSKHKTSIDDSQYKYSPCDQSDTRE
jgi:hypothetical protein